MAHLQNSMPTWNYQIPDVYQTDHVLIVWPSRRQQTVFMKPRYFVLQKNLSECGKL